MLFEKLTSQENKEKIYNSYCSSFPEDERRNEKDFWDLFNNPNTEILFIFNEENFIGYLIIWKFPQFIFIEHFEVFEEFRGQKLGSKILETLHKKHQNIILETEPAILNQIAERRVNFYQRNGYSILKKNYIQPKYSEEKNNLELWLMGTFVPENLEQSISEIYKIVYQVK